MLTILQINKLLPVNLRLKYGLNTNIKTTMFLANCEAESGGFKTLIENLNYGAAGLLETFGKYFNKDNVNDYAHKPKDIANIVYANRFGNGSPSSGDGWMYRGRGFLQLTFKANYQNCSKDTGMDIVNNPDLLLDSNNAMIASLWYWNSRNMNNMTPFVVSQSRKLINGNSQDKLADTTLFFQKYLTILQG
jgi:putative chitinase